MRSLLVAAACLAVVVMLAGHARAQPENAAREASRHFQRGVDLYGEGDYRGALVEFKKAQTLLPRAAVLYNIGQTEYQLQDYAQSLRTLERFLAETGPNATHRSEVEETVEVLRGRVGRITVASDRADCEVAIDDQPAGTTPLVQPVLVSIGRRRVALTCPGRPRVTRDVDVAAGELARVELDGESVAAPTQILPAATAPASAPPARPPSRSGRGATAAWMITAGLAAATIGVYTAAFVETRQLGDLRRSYPISAEQLDDKVTLTSRLALTGDVLAIGTAVAAGVSAYLAWGSREERATTVAVGPGAVTVQGRF